MPLSDAKKAANLKWDKANMTNLSCRVRRDYAEAVKSKAAADGTTVGRIIRDALDRYMFGGEDRK